jgi:hypothetical protein
MYQIPPRRRDPQGRDRRIGFELEFAGLTPAESSRLIADLLGGTAEDESPFRSWVRGTHLGDFRVEIDSSYLSDHRYLEVLSGLGFQIDLPGQDLLESLMASLAMPVVPVEVVSPPIPFKQASVMDEVREALRLGMARGTRTSILYAFGLHLNVTVASIEARDLLATIQAFLLVEGWLHESIGVDTSRRLGPYVEPFTAAYRKLVLQAPYAPELDGLIDDYLAHNPTRNRTLDLLPLFAWLREHRVKDAIEEPELNVPRPVFHYRMPDSMVDDPRWRIGHEWNRWVEVERLGDDEDRLESMVKTYATMVGP